MRAFVVLSLVFVALTGCDGEKKAEKNGKLTQSQLELLKSINNSFKEAEQAVNVALGAVSVSNVSEKVQKLAKALQDGECTRTHPFTGSDRYDMNWKDQQLIGCKTGVLTSEQTSEYVLNKRTWTLSEVFTTEGDFKKESLVTSYTIDGGLEVKTVNTQVTVNGTFDFRNFKVANLGLVTAKIETRQSYTGARGAGTLQMTLKIPRTLDVSLDVGWSTGRTPVYRLNRQEIDSKVFDELFSSYGIRELIDRSLRMR